MIHASHISQPVGAWEKGAVNLPDDVERVQTLLEAAAAATGDPSLDPGDADRKIARPPRSSATVKAIRAFQSRFLRNPDGVVEPGKTTMRELSKFAKDDLVVAVLTPVAWSARMLAKAYDAIPGLGDDECFPLSFVPKQSYKTGGRRFGARRKSFKGKGENRKFLGYRRHAGCDLIDQDGTQIYAVTDGEVINDPMAREFYRGTYSLVVRHENFVCRYCEIKSVEPGVKRGATVQGGKPIARMGKMFKSAMLHLEMYAGTASGPLTQRNQAPSKQFGATTPFQRRTDLIDPTPYLDKWKANLPS
jgi:murein DD-endopeptidase MepM/ murein hydrolase activator NlpD